jgi:hypothetical protein
MRAKDKAEGILSWRFFRPFGVDITGKQDSTVDPVGGFALSPTTPFKYHIFFASDAFVAEFQAAANKIRDDWRTFFAADVIAHYAGKTHAQIDSSTPEFEASLSRYLNTPGPTAFWSQLNHSFFWHAGQYSAELRVEAEKHRQPTTKTWTFSLTAEDSDNLRLNAVAILRSLCDASANYNFAYPEYVSTST